MIGPVNSITKIYQDPKTNILVVRHSSVYTFLSLKIWGSLPSSLQRFISKVYAPISGTIKLPNYIKKGAKINKIDEIVLFFLGSTCYMASPEAPKFQKK